MGLTSTENQFVTQVLTNSSSGQSIGVSVVAPTAQVVQNAAEVLIGNIRTTNVSNALVTSTGGPNTVTQVSVPQQGSGAVTNLVVDNTVTNVVLTGTQNNQVVSLFAGSNTSLVVGDVGSNFIVTDAASTRDITIVSGAGNDSILGGGGSDNLQAGGDSIINGGAGNDTLIGGAGSSTLGGGGGADSITAGAGGSYIIGEAGNDTLVGGSGKDVFIFGPGDGSDRIVNFNPAQDTLAFTTTNYTGGTLDLASLISNATISGGNTVLTLPDGSTLTVVGVTGVNINWFTAK